MLKFKFNFDKIFERPLKLKVRHSSFGEKSVVYKQLFYFLYKLILNIKKLSNHPTIITHHGGVVLNVHGLFGRVIAILHLGHSSVIEKLKVCVF